MRGEDFIDESKIGPDDCELCEVHKQAYVAIPDDTAEMKCPKCGKDELSMPYPGAPNPAVVSDGDNSCSVGVLASYNYEKHHLVHCYHCYANYKIELVPVIYNANHDVYYMNHPGSKE